MTRRDPIHSFRDMLIHAQEAVALVEGKQRDDLDNDRLLNLALVRLLEIIGEAANRIPKGSQVEQPTSSGCRSLGCEIGSSTAMMR